MDHIVCFLFFEKINAKFGSCKWSVLMDWDCSSQKGKMTGKVGTVDLAEF